MIKSFNQQSFYYQYDRPKLYLIICWPQGTTDMPFFKKEAGALKRDGT